MNFVQRGWNKLLIFLTMCALRSNNIEAVLAQYFPFGVEICGLNNKVVHLEDLDDWITGIGFTDAIKRGYLFGIILTPCKSMLPFMLVRQRGLASLLIGVPEDASQREADKIRIVGIKIAADAIFTPMLSLKDGRLVLTVSSCKERCRIYIISGEGA